MGAKDVGTIRRSQSCKRLHDRFRYCEGGIPSSRHRRGRQG